MKQVKDYINKEVAVYCDSQEEWNQMVELISKEIGIKCKPNRNYSKNTTNTLNLNNINKISSNIGVSDKGGYPAYTNYLASDFLEFQLPKCFYILRNDVVDEWLSKLSNGIITYSSITRKKYPYFIIEDLKYMACHYRKNTTESYPEISFEQFQQYVLKENSSNILEQCKKKYLPGTKFMTMTNIPKLETIKGIVRWSSSGNLIVDDNDFIIYEKSSNKFAEIVEETRFKIGKWYKYTREDIIQPIYAKYSSKQSVSNRFYYDEFISVNGYEKGHDWSVLSVKPVLLTDLSEIQQYLPEGHVDKIKSIPEYVEYINEKDSSWKFGKIYKVNEDGTVTFESGGNPCEKSYTTNTNYFKPSTKEAYEAQFVKETVKEWARNTYVVCIKDCENIKENSVYMITHSWDDSNPTIGVKESDKVLSKSNFKWFATKTEAEEFAKSLLNNNTMEEYKVGNWVIYIGDFSDNFNGLKNKAYEIINIRAGFIATLKTNTSNRECYCKNIRKALPHEIPTQTINNYPLTKEKCTINLRNTKIWIGDNPELCGKVQEKAFKLGYTWNSGDKTVKLKNSTFLEFWEDNTFTYSNDSKEHFEKSTKKEIFPSDLGIYEKIPELPNTIDVIDLKRSDVLSENILDFPTANRIIYSKPKLTLTELELPAPIKVIKREESYY